MVPPVMSIFGRKYKVEGKLIKQCIKKEINQIIFKKRNTHDKYLFLRAQRK